MNDDLAKLAADLNVVGEQAEKASYKALVVEASNMRDDWRKRVGGGSFAGARAALDYDVLPTGLRAITAEVGFRKEGQGKLGNVLEFGTSRSGGPIRPAGADVLRGGADRLEKYLGDLGSSAL